MFRMVMSATTILNDNWAIISTHKKVKNNEINEK